MRERTDALRAEAERTRLERHLARTKLEEELDGADGRSDGSDEADGVAEVGGAVR